MTPVTALGYMVGLHAWGRLVDRHGPRATLSITLILQALLALAWLVLPDSLLGISLWAGGVYFVWGALEGGHQMGQSRAMLGAIDKDHQAEGFALAIYASAIGGIAGGALGGALFQWAQGQHLDLLYLTVAQVGLLLPWALSRRLVGYRQQASVRSLFRRSATTS
jgi:predicted MFS family arabinose efflux permease